MSDPEVCVLEDAVDQQGPCSPEKATPLITIESAKSRLNASQLLQTKLVPVKCQFSLVKSFDHDESPIQSVIRKECRQSRADIAILYALRHPACGGCREKGKALAEYIQLDGKIALATVVKETGVTDKALMEYYEKYGLRNNIYKDGEWNIYKAMGGRKVSMCAMARGISCLMLRGLKKKVTPNLSQVTRGDLWTQGGVLIFDKRGELVHVVYEPQFGEELDMGEIKQAVRRARFNAKSMKTGGSSESTETSTQIDSL